MDIAPAFAIPPLHKRTRIPMRTIRAIARHIAKEFDPDSIILFGSHAYGKPGAGSDVDLLVIMETPEGEFAASHAIVKSLPPIIFRVDVIARSQSALEKRIQMGDRFMQEIVQKGKVLYACDR
jgi:predicted nucleotidyltransferase